MATIEERTAGGVSFGLTDEQRALRELAHDFAEREIRPKEREYDEHSTHPADVIAKAHELGLMNVHLPQELGGPGLSIFDGILVGEQTYLATKHAFEFRDAEPLQAKGKAEPVHVWEVVAEQDAVAARPRAEQQLIGRLEELEELSTFCNARLEEPHVGVVTILGSPGIGKSRLLLELVHRLEERCDVYWGRCLSYGEGITYWPVQEIVEDAAGILRQDDAEGKAAKLAALLESLGTTDKDELRSIAAAIWL